MSELESFALPLLRALIRWPGDRRLLSIEDQCILAAWATLRTMIFETQFPRGRRYFLQSERESFRETIEPPPNFYIWLALRLAGSKRFWPLWFRASKFLATGQKENAGLHIATFAVGHLTFEFVAWRGLPTPPIDLEGLSTRSDWSDSTVPIWPNPAPYLRWPAKKNLTEAALEEMSYRFMPPESLRL